MASTLPVIQAPAKMEPSAHQRAILDAVLDTTDNLIIQAAAGSGKTTTLRLICETVPIHTRTLAVCFNKSIAREFGNKLPRHVDSKTMHALGVQVCRSAVGDVKIDQYKTANVIEAYLSKVRNVHPKAMYALRNALDKLVSSVLATNADPRSHGALEGLCDAFNIDLDPKHFDRVSDILALTRRDIRTLSYDDMIDHPLYHEYPFPKYDLVLVDEAQDLSPQQIEFVARMAGTARIICVGDRCQPEGTIVDVVSQEGGRWTTCKIEKKKIENVNVGDKVVSISSSDGQWRRSKKVTGITSRPYEGRLIEIETESGLISRYTPNHICYTNFVQHRDRWCVYIMKRGWKFRIGKTKMNYRHGRSGLACRMIDECADAGWILDVYDTETEALQAEQILSANFGLPQLMFTAANNSSKLTAEKLEETWNAINENTISARECLEHFGRDINYPILVSGGNCKYSLLRPMFTHASNLISGCLVLPYKHSNKKLSIRGEGKRRRHVLKSDWETIDVRNVPYHGNVWSLSVEDDETYVADGILTHNCQAIYAFRGADATAMDRIQERFQCKEFPLSVCYRCGESIVKEAQGVVGEDVIQAAPGAHPGMVIRNTSDSYTDTVSKLDSGDLVLSRINRPLVSPCFELIRQGKKAIIRGRDIGSGLQAIITRHRKKAKVNDLDSLIDSIEAWSVRRMRKLKADGRENQAQTVEDQVQTIYAIAENVDTIDSLSLAILNTFSDQDEGVIFSSIHKAKGLEANCVVYLGPELVPHPMAKGEAAIAQEHNLDYVAKTRAIHALIYQPLETK